MRKPLKHAQKLAFCLELLQSAKMAGIVASHSQKGELMKSTPLTELATTAGDAAGSDLALPVIPFAFSDENLRAMFDKVAAETTAEVPDVTTPDGRARIRSLAAKVAASKTAIDKPMRDHLRVLKTMPKVLEASARASLERFDGLKHSLMAPLEAAEAPQRAVLDELLAIPTRCTGSGVTLAQIDSMSSYAGSVDLANFWPEYQKKITAARESAMVVAADALERAAKAAAQAAEIERLRAEAAEQARAAREREVAERAANEAREAERRRAIDEQERMTRAKVAAEMRAEAQERENARLAASMETQAKAAAESAARAVELARESERQRIAEAEALQIEEAKRREADKEHRITVNREALADLIALGIDDTTAKMVVTAIARGQVRNIKVIY